MLRLLSGSTDQYLHFYAPPGLSSFTVRRKRGGNASAAMTTPTVAEDGSAAGLYSLLLDEDTTITSAKSTEVMSFYISAAGMTTQVQSIELVGASADAQAIIEAMFTADSGETAGSAVAGSPVFEIGALAASGGLSAEDIREEMDSNSTQLALIVEDTGTTLPGLLATIAGYIDTEMATVLAAVDTEVAAIKAKTDQLVFTTAGQVDATAITVSDKTGFRLSATGVDDILDEIVESTLTLRHCIRLMNAALHGKSSGLDTGSPVYRDPADTKNRISATSDDDGNRSAVTRDAT